jgi:major membrane immunogen (membrane-anchored lipoprotein)
MILMLTLLTSCSSTSGDCSPIEAKWADTLMMNDLHYQHDYPDPDDEKEIKVEKGKLLGEVKYKLADDACEGYQMKNNDATLLDEGTKIYAIKDIPPSLAVVTYNEDVLSASRVFVVDQNKKAKTIGEFYPIQGLVKEIHIESTLDGRRIHTFSPSAKEAFLKEWLPLKLQDPEKLDDRWDENQMIFLEFELLNGITFRQSYNKNSYVFHIGAVGNAAIAEIIENEYDSIH